MSRAHARERGGGEEKRNMERVVGRVLSSRGGLTLLRIRERMVPAPSLCTQAISVGCKVRMRPAKAAGYTKPPPNPPNSYFSIFSHVPFSLHLFLPFLIAIIADTGVNVDESVRCSAGSA